MNDNRKASTITQDKRLTDAYSGIFRGLYWRHEFARRNDAVSNGSKELAKALGFKPTRFERFIQDARPLTDELVRVCMSGSTPEKTALREFLKTYKVLPTTWSLKSESTYFPLEFGLRDGARGNHVYDTFWVCKALFNSLLLFEAYSMSHLNIGHPLMFPLMPLVVFGRKMEQLHLDDFPAPVLLDRFAPVELIGQYSDALDFEMEWGRYEKNREESKKTPEKPKKMAEKKKDASTKIPWDSLAAYVRIYDYSLTNKTGMPQTNFIINYYSEHIDPSPEKPKNDYQATAIASYHSQLNAAMHQIENYQNII